MIEEGFRGDLSCIWEFILDIYSLGSVHAGSIGQCGIHASSCSFQSIGLSSFLALQWRSGGFRAFPMMALGMKTLRRLPRALRVQQFRSSRNFKALFEQRPNLRIPLKSNPTTIFFCPYHPRSVLLQESLVGGLPSRPCRTVAGCGRFAAESALQHPQQGTSWRGRSDVCVTSLNPDTRDAEKLTSSARCTRSLTPLDLKGLAKMTCNPKGCCFDNSAAARV